MRKNETSYEELAAIQRQEELKKYIVPDSDLIELTTLLSEQPKEKIQRRSGRIRSGWGWKL
jgi:hypothetical protein